MGARLRIESHARNGVGTVRVRGELDLHSIDQLVDAAGGVTIAGGRVELDLREVAFIDSAGVAGLNRCRRQAQQHQADLVVVCTASSPVSRLLHWTGLASVIEVRDD
jgi:anti-anti-sigma factor